MFRFVLKASLLFGGCTVYIQMQALPENGEEPDQREKRCLPRQNFNSGRGCENRLAEKVPYKQITKRVVVGERQ